MQSSRLAACCARCHFCKPVCLMIVKLWSLNLTHLEITKHQKVECKDTAGELQSGEAWSCFISIGLLVKLGHGSYQTVRQKVLQSF